MAKKLKGPSFAEQLSERIAPYLQEAVKNTADGGIQFFDDYIKKLNGQKASDNDEILNSVIRSVSMVDRPVTQGKISVLQMVANTSDMLTDYINKSEEETSDFEETVEKVQQENEEAEAQDDQFQRTVKVTLNRQNEKLQKIDKDVNTPIWLKIVKGIGKAFAAGWFLDTFGDVIKGFVEGLLESLNLKGVIERLKEFTKDKFPTAYNIATVVKNKLKDWYDAIQKFMEPVYKWVNKNALELLNWIQKVFNSTKMLVRSAMSKDERTEYWKNAYKEAGLDKLEPNSALYLQVLENLKQQEGYLGIVDKAAMRAASKEIRRENKENNVQTSNTNFNYSILESNPNIVKGGVTSGTIDYLLSAKGKGHEVEGLTAYGTDEAGNPVEAKVVQGKDGGLYTTVNNVTKIVYANQGRELTH